jgi:hypothetical protein
MNGGFDAASLHLESDLLLAYTAFRSAVTLNRAKIDGFVNMTGDVDLANAKLIRSERRRRKPERPA